MHETTVREYLQGASCGNFVTNLHRNMKLSIFPTSYNTATHLHPYAQQFIIVFKN